MADEELRRISKKYYDDEAGDLTVEEIETLIDFFEDIGLYHSRKLVDFQMLDESFGDHIIDCYDDEAVRKHIYGTRAEERDNSYWERFERLALEMTKARNKRREQQ
jgi:hypothetical protein